MRGRPPHSMRRSRCGAVACPGDCNELSYPPHMSLKRVLGLVLLLIAAVAGLVAWLNFRGEEDIPAASAPFAATHAQIERGRYLACAGNCIACHTARGGEAYAGGLGVRTPFGTVYSSNITPDSKTGIGTWNAGHFW